MTGAVGPDGRPRRQGWSAPWQVLLAACVLGLTLVDAILLQLDTHYFSGGFNAFATLSGPGQTLLFLGGGLLIDASCVLLAWLVILPVLSRLPLVGVQRWALAGMLGVAAPLAWTFFRYELQRYLGDLADLELVRTLAGGWTLEMLAQGSSHLVPFVGALLGAVGAAAGLLWVLRRAHGDARASAAFAPPATRALLVPLALCAGGAFVVLPASCLGGSDACFGLVSKPGGGVISELVQRLTDVDRDGAGLLSTPPDPAPFDGAIHAYALDVPGNGVDENGLAGDLPGDFHVSPAASATPPVFTRRPHVLLIFGESLRGDVLDERLNGRKIMPFVAGLGAEGASSRLGFTNTPYTSKARAQLFGGRVDPFDGQTSLRDDFAANGYVVAHFSGQDDSFGGRDHQLGRAQPDVYYDARQDPDRRASRFSTAGSLAVSWKLLNQRIGAFLADYDATRPLFLYVNYHDTHFPYHHAEMDRILDVDPLPRHEIRPENAERLWETYANAAANVDRGIEQLVGAFRAAIGDAPHVILVTADHGESLFEAGFLGHGQSLGAAQTRVPMVIWGVGGDWPEPLGLADLRGLLQRTLSIPGRDGAPPQPRLVAPAGREIFQYMARLGRPRLIGLRGADGLLQYALRLDRLEREAAPEAWTRLDRHAQAEPFARLIHSWEALDQREAASQAAARALAAR